MPLAPCTAARRITGAVGYRQQTLPVWPGPRFSLASHRFVVPPAGGQGARATGQEQGLRTGRENSDPARPGPWPEGVTLISPLQKRFKLARGLPWFRHHCQAILKGHSTAVEPLSEKETDAPGRWRRSARHRQTLGLRVAKVGGRFTLSSPPGLGAIGPRRCWLRMAVQGDPPSCLIAFRISGGPSASFQQGATAANYAQRRLTARHLWRGRIARGWGARLRKRLNGSGGSSLAALASREQLATHRTAAISMSVNRAHQDSTAERGRQPVADQQGW